MGILQDTIGAVTGQTAVDNAARQSRISNRNMEEFLANARQIFQEQIGSIASARESGVFNPDQIRKQVMGDVENLFSNLRASGLAQGAKTGDTAQSERIAQGAIAGGRALENVPFLALQRELGALNQVNLGPQGQAVGLQAGQAAQGAQAAAQGQAGRIGGLASLGFGLTQGGGSQAPQFGSRERGFFNNLPPSRFF